MLRGGAIYASVFSTPGWWWWGGGVVGGWVIYASVSGLRGPNNRGGGGITLEHQNDFEIEVGQLKSEGGGGGLIELSQKLHDFKEVRHFCLKSEGSNHPFLTKYTWKLFSVSQDNERT